MLTYGVPQKTAQQLAKSLDRVSVEAGEVAQKASYNGNLNRAIKFGDISFAAGQLEREVRQGVVRPLKQGEPLRRVQNNLQGLNRDFQRLNDHILEVNQMPVTLEHSIADTRALLRELRQELNGAGGGGGGRLIECRAADQGFEEHILQPHVGFGQTLKEAEKAALRACEAHHGRCRIVTCR